MVKTLLGDGAIAVAVMLSIPVAILLVGAPIVLVVRLLMAIGNRLS